ncbi:unnamed protein product [Brachionus calyciflorus]|uniref:Uncharacterized protein n=1 Tax=Brachionus calyciflorus TaxID=104777 RepID=A0A814AIK4_9BILA|nr:unnamed protein product [Brachionus calyciflorus]
MSSNNQKPGEQRINLPYLTLGGVSPAQTVHQRGIQIIQEKTSKISLTSSCSSLSNEKSQSYQSHVNTNHFVNTSSSRLHQLHESESAPNLLPLINSPKTKLTNQPIQIIKTINENVYHPSVSSLKSTSNFKKRFSDITQLESISKKKDEKDQKLKEFEFLQTVGTGTFGRVILTKNTITNEYNALKLMSIPEIIRLKQIDHVKNEKLILSTMKPHPFIVRLLWTHHNSQFLFMLMEYLPGGELFTLLKQKQKFDVKTTLFYIAEIVCALEYLHSFQIAYRDLKPENILLDSEGHIKLTDFGFSKKIPNKTYTLCGTPEYLAPELIMNKGHDLTCDWWSLGVLIYEFLSGSPPFYDENRNLVYEKILMGKIEWPRYFDSVSRDIIKKLMNPDPTKRLGSGNCGVVKDSSNYLQQKINEQDDILNGMVFLTEPDFNLNEDFPNSISKTNSNDSLGSLDMGISFKKNKINIGSEEVKRHRWFISITNWNDVYEKRLQPPFLPEISHPGDTRNFDFIETPDLSKAPAASDKQLDFFYNF